MLAMHSGGKVGGCLDFNKICVSERAPRLPGFDHPWFHLQTIELCLALASLQMVGKSPNDGHAILGLRWMPRKMLTVCRLLRAMISLLRMSGLNQIKVRNNCRNPGQAWHMTRGHRYSTGVLSNMWHSYLIVWAECPKQNMAAFARSRTPFGSPAARRSPSSPPRRLRRAAAPPGTSALTRELTAWLLLTPLQKV